ncbi:MAG: FkbM family methyltransferase [bacterium]|nr:FkbM family methyltransferase [bacterium]
MLLKKRIKNYKNLRKYGLSPKDALLVILKSARMVTAPFDTGGRSIITNWRDARGLYDHEPKTRKWLEGKKGVFYDIGAHIGKFAFMAEKQGLKVYAFEPHFENFRTLCHNVMLNESDVTPFPLAILGKTCIKNFSLSSIYSGSANHGNKPESNRAIDLVAFSIDDLENILKLPPPEYLKIDVDGAETEIITNSSLHSVKEILVEIGSKTAEELIHKNLSVNFQLFDTDELIGVGERGEQYPRNEFWKRK